MYLQNHSVKRHESLQQMLNPNATLLMHLVQMLQEAMLHLLNFVTSLGGHAAPPTRSIFM